PVVVDVGHVHTHCGEAQVGGPVLDLFPKGSVPLVYIEVIPFVKVIGDVDVGPEVAVEVRDHDPQAKTDEAPIDSRLLAHIHKFAVVVAQQHIADPPENIRHLVPVLGPDVPLFGIAHTAYRYIAVVQDVHVQFSIPIV